MTHDNFGILHFSYDPIFRSRAWCTLSCTGFYMVLQRLREHWNSCIISTQSHTCMETCILLLIIMPNHASAGWHVKSKLCFLQIMCCFADFKHARIVDLLHYASNTRGFFQRAGSNIAGWAGRCELPWIANTRTRWLADVANSRKQGLGSFKTEHASHLMTKHVCISLLHQCRLCT